MSIPRIPQSLKGTLFTTDFLSEGIQSFPEWTEFIEKAKSLREALIEIYDPLTRQTTPNEAVTCDTVIIPTLNLLDWTSILSQQTLASRGRADVPDYVLFPDESAYVSAAEAVTELNAYETGAVVVEAKRWDRPLDKRSRRRSESRTPSSQMLRYLRRIDDLTSGGLRYGILSNGRVWRLYWSGSRFVSEDFLEIDIFEVIGLSETDLFELSPDEQIHWLAVFIGVFSKSSFVPKGTERQTLHDRARKTASYYEERVTKQLSTSVFRDVYPALAKAIFAQAPDEDLDAIRDTTLVCLYRLLFILYAEDRDLLPINTKRYQQYSMRDQVRKPVGDAIDAEQALGSVGSKYWSATRTLFKMIDKGEPEVGLPPYNGGLFNQAAHQLLSSVDIPDNAFAPIIDALSYSRIDGKRRYINYRNLSVQQLGAVYERLLSYRFKMDGEDLAVTLDSFARKSSGSYYTPDNLVGFIVDQTLSDHIKAAQTNFSNAVATSKDGSDLLNYDPAQTILSLKVCDPAMGSGHFLVNLVDWLTDTSLAAMAEAEAEADKHDFDYHSPVITEIERIRSTILTHANQEGWVIDESQLEDRHIVRRMVLKRCIYGVDKNPMAVELAKVSLWLHTFTVGAPLSFLDHHLRAGDSLFGGQLKETVNSISKFGGSLTTSEIVRKAVGAAAAMGRVERSTDAEIAEAKESAKIYAGVRAMLSEVDALMCFIHALKWIKPDKEQTAALKNFFGGHFGNPEDILAGKSSLKRPPKKASEDLMRKQRDLSTDYAIVSELIKISTKLNNEEIFFNWQTEFPGVWTIDEITLEPSGGFDAVVGNPPWEKMKLDQKQWFSERFPQIAEASNKSERESLIKKLQTSDPELYNSFTDAYDRSMDSLRVARTGGGYPKTGSGDLNFYALFVEKSESITSSNGIVGLLTPVGVGTDMSMSVFFGSISKASRLGAFLSFENKGKWLFEDVHAEDQPTFILFGGRTRTYSDFTFATKLHSLPTPKDDRIVRLDSGACQRLNPNTGTVPMFRDPGSLPLVERMYKTGAAFCENGLSPIWPVRFSRDFDMTNQSDLFKREDQLAAEGAFLLEGGNYGTKDGDYFPLYEGKSITLHNHRYSSVTRTGNLSGQGKTIKASDEELSDPNFVTTPWYWIHERELTEVGPYVLGFNDVANTNNRRTVITAIVPKAGYGNKLPLLRQDTGVTALEVSLMAANLGSIPLDFVARQKIQSRNLNKYILDQLPIIPLETIKSQNFGPKSAADIVADAILELSYNSHAMRQYAKEMKYIDEDGEAKPPVAWNIEKRVYLTAKLDAVFFHLYKIIDPVDVDYIFSTFPKIEADDIEEFGYYRTRDLTKSWINALAAGRPDAKVTVNPS